MLTVNDMLDKYEREKLPKLAEHTQKDYVGHIKHLRVDFGTRDVRSITRAEIKAYSVVSQGPVHRIRRISMFRSAFSAAVRWDWVEGNPCTYLEKSKVRTRDPPLTMQEFEKALKFVEEANPRTGKVAALAMELALHTGGLQRDVIGLKWTHVDFAAGTILFRDSRNKKKKILVQLTPEIKQLLDRAKELFGEGVHVIKTRKGTRYSSESFRALWQRYLVKWDETAHDRIYFTDIRHLSKKIFAEKKEAGAVDPVDDFPQFTASAKSQAALNAPYYKVFFCLEQLIRQQVTDTLENAAGDDWWNTDKIPLDLRREVASLATKELDTGITQRSPRQIDYTTFGQLGQIIRENWDLFKKQFKTTKGGVSNILVKLNYARGPIAHCCPLSELEIERLALTIRDWFSNLASSK